MSSFYVVNIAGRDVSLPVLRLKESLSIAFFNLHGAQELTEHCASALTKLVSDAEVVLTAESKGLQLAHCIARNLGQDYYAVARKSKKLYMQDGIAAEVKSITTEDKQTLYLSKHDVSLLQGKRVAIVDDVISTGGSLAGLVRLVELAGGRVYKKAFVLAEGRAKERTDIVYLAEIPLL